MIRLARVDDIPLILDLAGKFHKGSQYERVLPLDTERIAHYVRGLIENADGCVLLAEMILGKLDGMMGLLKHENWVSGEVVVAELFWWVEDKNEGIGGLMLREAEECAKEAGAAAIVMIVPADSAWLAGALERRGYAFVEGSYMKRLTCR